MGFADLHIHTLFSDGRISPSDLIGALYQEKDLDCFSLTDHDTLSGIEPLFRGKRAHESGSQAPAKRFIPGIELTLMEATSGLTVHMLGFFPQVNEQNHKKELKRIDAVIGEYCLFRCRHRAERDLDARVKYAFETNLDGLADHYDSAETVIRLLRDKGEEENRRIFEKLGKTTDIIRHPIPLTYQTMIDHWETLLPTGSAEKIALYILRPDQKKQEKLARIYRAEGKSEAEATRLAAQNQSMLYNFKRPPPRDKTIFEGLACLQEAGAVTFIAHPAVDHQKIGYEAFDRSVLFPLLDKGLDGIEVWYPYDMRYREEAIAHYGRIAKDKGALVTGGTDYHGDGRVKLGEVKLGMEEVEKITRFHDKT